VSAKITGFRKVLYDSGYMTGEEKQTIQERNSGIETHDHENKQMINEKKTVVFTERKITYIIPFRKATHHKDQEKYRTRQSEQDPGKETQNL
jgi:hypothetical protein